MTQNIIINEELKHLLPPLSEAEFAGLEESIVKDGCLSPLIVWNDILVDGHHRYEICMKRHIPYAIKHIVLENLDDAKLWAGRHQENRRNLADYHRIELALKLKDVLAAKAKERQGQRNDLHHEDNIPSTLTECKETREELAQMAGVSSGSLTKGAYIAEHADEETKKKLRKGEKGTSINKEYNRLKAEEKAAAKTRSKSGKTKTKVKSSETITVSLKSSPKVKDRYSCGVKFEPDPNDDYFDWISDVERKELFEMRKTCPNRLVPQIHNFTIQNIPEHSPEPLLSCLYFLFKIKYREKLAYGLLRRIFAEDDPELARTIISNLQNEFLNH
ncbi:MAG TPA: hypothetical protein DEB39_10355 [Planctomycetaceae bacterium]|nr:hypothetical protein [Planctomycetaceae bacterium]